ncbi:MAG: hypothetical protein KUG59_08100 [Parvibaculaceae bacterium]|nr:hypothetical protein [Parvibaculaceae bacterium]
MKKYIVMMAAALILAGCAKSPSSIAPLSVNSDEYSEFSCEQLRAEQTKVSSALDDATSNQHAAQAADALGVFLVLIPVSAIVGDSESDIAQFKGEKLAIERGISKRNC